MIRLYNLLKSSIKKGNLTSIKHIIPEVNAIFNSSYLFNELANANLIEWSESNYNKKKLIQCHVMILTCM